MFTQVNLWIGAVAGAAACALLTSLYIILIHDPMTRAETRSLIEAQARERAMVLIEKASKDHAEISAMDKSGACIELGGKWVPDPGRCD